MIRSTDRARVPNSSGSPRKGPLVPPAPRPYNGFMAKRGDRRPVPLADVLRDRLRVLGWERRIHEQDILSRWEEAVGPRIAGQSRPLFVKNRRLTVAVYNPVWESLALLKNDLLRRFEKLLGEKLIDDLYFTSGRAEPASALREEPPLPSRPLPPETVEAIGEEASHIADSDLREAFRNVLLASSRRKKNPP